MYLPNSSVKAVLDAAPKPIGAPVRIVDLNEQRAFLEALSQDIKDANRDCKAEITPAGRGTNILAIVFEVNAKQSRGSYWDSMQLQVQFKDNEAIIVPSYSYQLQLPFVNIEQIWDLVDRLRKKMLEKLAREQKQKKLKELKTRSIEAQIEILAARLQFAYRLERKHTKVVLVVQLDGRQSLYVDIPLGKLQDTLDRLESLIGQVNDLYGEGLRFKIGASPYGEFQQPKPVE
jgi:hypothetical protein